MADTHAQSLSSPETFWADEATRLTWTTPPKTILQTHPPAEGQPPKYSWFPDGELSASYNLVTRHVLDGRGADTAIFWDSPVAGEKRRISYAELQEEMELLADVLRNLGVKIRDRVLVYSRSMPFLQGRGY
jgi:propionyl-CoA synthetase